MKFYNKLEYKLDGELNFYFNQTEVICLFTP